MKSKIQLIVVSLLLVAGLSFAGTITIPPDRLGPWAGNVGIPGGIPNRTTIYTTLSPLGGGQDDAPQIKAAVAACPAGQVVKLSPGTFEIASTVNNGSKSNVTLRGSGQGVTIAHVAASVNIPFYTSGIEPWPPLQTGPTVTAGATRGSTTITVNDTSAFVVSNLFNICPSTPVWAHYLGGNPDTDRGMGVLVRLVSKTATTLTFDPPIPFDYSTMAGTVIAIPWPGDAGAGFHPATMFGYESFTIDMNDTQGNWAIEIGDAYACWVYDMEIEHCYTRQTYTHEAVRCEFRHNYVHDARAQGPNHEGMDFNNASWILIEDNIFNQAGAMATIWENASNRSAGNVVSYNYIINAAPGWWDISFNHGPHNMCNLTEGNKIQWYKDDGYFGSSSHNTIFRNRITYQIALKHFCNYYNIVGNIIGTVGDNTVYEATQQGVFEPAIYELGYPNIGNNSWTVPYGPTTPPDYHLLGNTLDECQQWDQNVKATLFRTANFDTVNNAVVYDPANPDRVIPNSMIYTVKPAWWGNTIPWPSIGPDLNPMTGTIPAEDRFLNGQP